MKQILFILSFVAILSVSVFATSSIELPAVDTEGVGILSSASVTTTSGSGDVFMSITPLTGIDTQHSEKTAVTVAAKKAKINSEKFNVMFKIESSAEVVDGPSAGAALTLITYSEFSGKKMRKDLTLTGTIDKDGKIGKIGGVFEKAQAVAESKLRKYKVFLIPHGQRIQNGVDLAEYADQKWRLQVVEVDNIDDAINYAFNTTEGSKIDVVHKPVPPLVLIPFKASGDSQAFKKISANEVGEAKARFKTAKIGAGASAQVSELLKEADMLISKGYYYSAANTAFLASISLDEIKYANFTSRELKSALRDLKMKLEGLNFTNQTEKNYEWVVGAKLRYYWAKDRISNADDDIASSNAPAAAGDLALANSWLRAAYAMNQIASQMAEGAQMKDIYYRDIAERVIDEAKGLERDQLLDQEGSDHLKTASLEFENADYLTALFDASFATAYATALDRISEKSYAEAVQSICKSDDIELTCGIFREKQFGSLWEELYYAHALYNIQDSNRTRDPATLLNGVKLLELSNEFRNRREQVLDILRNPGKPAVTATALPNGKQGGNEVRVEVVSVPENYTRDLILYSIVALAALLILYAYFTRRKQVDKFVTAEITDKVERAEELLLAGKISERSFEYFKKKYGGGNSRRKKRK